MHFHDQYIIIPFNSLHLSFAHNYTKGIRGKEEENCSGIILI